MYRILSSLLYILIFASCNAPQIEYSIDNGVVVEKASIISPVDQTISKENYIIITGDSILYIGTVKPTIKGSFQTINAEGKFIIPGLIDSHVHVTSIDGLTDKEETQNPEIVKRFKEQLPKSYLYYGYTTLVDLGASKPERLSEFTKTKLRPDLYFVGGGAVIGNGYGLTNWNDEIPNFIYPEDESYPIPGKYKKENHTPEAVVKRIAKSGAIAVKTYYEPGFDPTKPRLPVPTVNLINKLKEETHKYNMVLAAHGNSLEAHRFLGNNDIDIIAHGLWNWGNHKIDKSKTLPQEIAQTLDTEIRNKVYYIPTLQVINGLAALADTTFLNDPELANVLPSNLIEYYKENANDMYIAVFGGAPKEIILNSFDRISRQGKASLKYMVDNNGLVLFGTDTPSSPTFGNPPGYNGYLEMLEMHKAGVSLKQILASATINNAKAYGLEKFYGTLEPGKKANLLILNKNPLKDISSYNDIDKIIISGKVISRSTLSAKTSEE